MAPPIVIHQSCANGSSHTLRRAGALRGPPGVTRVHRVTRVARVTRVHRVTRVARSDSRGGTTANGTLPEVLVSTTDAGWIMSASSRSFVQVCVKKCNLPAYVLSGVFKPSSSSLLPNNLRVLQVFRYVPHSTTSAAALRSLAAADLQPPLAAGRPGGRAARRNLDGRPARPPRTRTQ